MTVFTVRTMRVFIYPPDSTSFYTEPILFLLDELFIHDLNVLCFSKGKIILSDRSVDASLASLTRIAMFVRGNWI